MLFRSAKTGEGIERLLARLRATFDTGSIYDGDPVISNSRHLEALRQALDALHRALTALDDDRSADLLSEDIRQVIHHLGTIGLNYHRSHYLARNVLPGNFLWECKHLRQFCT